MNEPLDLDVAILGGGLAGNLFARQLQRQMPALRSALFERDPETSWKVGESSVEIASNYFTRRLGLSRYLYEQQLPKNGLRFFFDTPEKDGELEELSEVGSVGLPHLPSFQLDRARFERDLRRMNAEVGVPTHAGRVQDLVLAPQGSADAHRFHHAPKDGPPREVHARWIIDAAGRAGLIARREKLWVPEDHFISAVWARFENVVDLDDVGSPAFRQRVKNTSRFLSTTHFCYPGYWIWFIPLGRGVVSVGVVMKRDQFDDAWRKEEGLMAFLNGHRAPARLLEGAKLLDIGSYKQLAYGTTKFFGERWACVGEAGAFTDPLYSPGSDFIGMENDFACDLVRREVAGDGYEAQRDRYDGFMRFRHDSTIRIYKDLYGTLGSYDLYRLKWDFDIASYYNLWLEPYLRDAHLEPEWLDGQLRHRPLVLGVMERFSALFQEVEAHLRAEGRMAEHNLGHFTGDFPHMRCAERLGSDASLATSMDRIAAAFNDVRTRALAMLGRDAGEPWPLRNFLAGKAMG